MKKELGVIALLALLILLMAFMSTGFQSYKTSGQPTTKATALTSNEKYWLLYLQEEEKMAGEVYLSLDDAWNMSVFRNTSVREQKNMNEINSLLVKYGIPVAADKAQGEYNNTTLQDLYDDLIQRGKVSEDEALKVGLFIEEKSIQDLNEGINATTHKDIKTIYQNHLKISRNHLKAFTL